MNLHVYREFRLKPYFEEKRRFKVDWVHVYWYGSEEHLNGNHDLLQEKLFLKLDALIQTSPNP